MRAMQTKIGITAVDYNYEKLYTAKYWKDINANEKIRSSDCTFLHLLIVSLCMYSVEHMHAHSTHMVVRGPLVGLSLLLQPYGALELNSSHQAWRQVR